MCTFENQPSLSRSLYINKKKLPISKKINGKNGKKVKNEKKNPTFRIPETKKKYVKTNLLIQQLAFIQIIIEFHIRHDSL